MIENITSTNSARQTSEVKPAENKSALAEKEPAAIKNTSAKRDEYVPSEEKEPIGLYSVSPDENGDPRISRDDDMSDTVTCNTDKVDHEIKSLRDKEQALRQKLRSADEDSAAEIRRELERISAELAQKDNDEYRRQNAVFS